MRSPLAIALAVSVAIAASASAQGTEAGSIAPQLLERSHSSTSTSRANTPEPRAIDNHLLAPRDAMITSDRMVKRVASRSQEEEGNKKRWVWADHVIQDGDSDVPANNQNVNELSGTPVDVNTPTVTQAAPTFPPSKKRWVWADHVIQDGDSDVPANNQNVNELSGTPIALNTPTVTTRLAPTFPPASHSLPIASHSPPAATSSGQIYDVKRNSTVALDSSTPSAYVPATKVHKKAKNSKRH